MRDHVRAVGEETLGMHGSGDADGAILMTEEVDYVESYIIIEGWDIVRHGLTTMHE